MEGGATKPIAEIKSGDKVAAADPQTGDNQGARTVVATFVKRDTDLVDVVVEAPEGKPATLHTTDNHPFWDATDRAWVLAENLVVGHDLETATGSRVHVVAVHKTNGAADRFSLTVAQLHTYYVLAGATPVLVHNCNGDTPGLLSDSHQPIGDPNAKGGIYALVSDSGEVQRTGMATDLADRLATHARKYPDLKGVVLYRTDSREARRGLEEMAERWFTPKLAGQMAINLANPRRQEYLQAARDFLDQWSGGTG
jgi:hypothetical protein